MLPKQYRLSKKDFPVVKKEGQKFFGPLFGLLIKKEDEKENSKFGFIVSKKVDKRAVVRNKIKRRLREAVFSFLPEIKLGTKTIFLAKRSLIDKDFGEIKTEVKKIFHQGGLL